MKRLILLLSMAVSANALALDVKLSDSAWDGVKVPEGQQCQKFGGKNPSTPALSITDIPKGSDTIVFVYSDRDSKRMNNAGHGIIELAISADSVSVEVPAVSGHTYELPEGFKMISAHRGPNWDKEGAYMPPCSGGKDHAYYVTVQTLTGNTLTGETVLEIGKY